MPTFRGPLPLQTLLRSLFASAFGVSGSRASTSRPEVRKPEHWRQDTAPSAARARQEPRLPRSLPGSPGGAARAEAVTCARQPPPRSLPSRVPVATPVPAPPGRGPLTHRGLRGASPTDPGGRGAGTAPPALTSAPTCRSSPHSAPAWRSVCRGCGGRGPSG